MKNIFLDQLEEDLQLFEPAAPPIIETLITEAKNRIRKGYYDVITENFKWSAKVKRRFRDNIDVNELHDPLNLYGQWIKKTKVTPGYIMFTELHLEQELTKGAVYITNSGEKFIATSPHCLECSANFKKRKDIVNVYKAGDFLTLTLYGNTL